MTSLHLRLLKIIALIDLFKERSGLVANAAALRWALSAYGDEEIKDTLEALQTWSLLIYRKFNDAYSVFEGSDFDIDDAVGRMLASMADVDFVKLNAIAGLQPIVAKRHYHETGALRWFDVAIAPLAEVQATAAEHCPQHGAVGTFLLAVPTQGEPANVASHIVQSAVSNVHDGNLVIGLPQGVWNITSLSQELLAIEQVRADSPQLQGDQIARREVEARISALRGYMESELSRALDSALWYAKDLAGVQRTQAQRNGLASDLADLRFHASPRLHNELLNRVKPSSNAVAAQNVLLRRMVQNEGEERLGIEGFPARGWVVCLCFGSQ